MMTSSGRAVMTRVLLVRTVTSLVLATMVCTTSSQSAATGVPLTGPLTNPPTLAIPTTTILTRSNSMSALGAQSSSTTGSFSTPAAALSATSFGSPSSSSESPSVNVPPTGLTITTTITSPATIKQTLFANFNSTTLFTSTTVSFATLNISSRQTGMSTPSTSTTSSTSAAQSMNPSPTMWPSSQSISSSKAAPLTGLTATSTATTGGVASNSPSSSAIPVLSPQSTWSSTTTTTRTNIIQTSPTTISSSTRPSSSVSSPSIPVNSANSVSSLSGTAFRSATIVAFQTTMPKGSTSAEKITSANGASPTTLKTLVNPSGLSGTTGTAASMMTTMTPSTPFTATTVIRSTRAETISSANVRSPTTLINLVNSSGQSATTNTVLSTVKTTTTTSPSPVLVEQRVLIVCSNSFTVVFGPSATTASVAVSGSAATMTPGSTGTTGTTGTTKLINNSRSSTGAFNPSAGTRTTMTRTETFTTASNISTSRPTSVAYPVISTSAIPAVTTVASTTKLPDVTHALYSFFLFGVIARTATISNSSRVVNVSVFGEATTNRLVIQFTILDGKMPTAAEAVANLKRLTGSTNAGRRRRSASMSSFYLTDIYNQTLSPVIVVNWTDAGACPNDTCRNGGVCRGRTDGTLYCDCPSPDLQAPLCDVATSEQSQNQEPWSCLYDVSCIVPAVVVPVVGLLLIVVIVVVIVIVVQRRRLNDKGRDLRKIRQQRRTISTVDAAFTPAHFEGVDDGQSGAMMLREISKAESRSRFKKAKRQSKIVGRSATSSRDRRSQLEHSNKRPTNVVLVGDDGGTLTSTRTSALTGSSGTLAPTSMPGTPSDVAVIAEIVSY